MVAITWAKLVSIAGYGVVAAIALTQPKIAPVIAVVLVAVSLRDALSDERSAIPVIPGVLIILCGVLMLVGAPILAVLVLLLGGVTLLLMRVKGLD